MSRPDIGADADGPGVDDTVAPGSDGPDDAMGELATPTAEELFAALDTVSAERDSYLETAQRIQAEFDNFRKRTASEVDDRVRNGLARMAESLLPVLDTCDAAIGQGDESAEALRSQLLAVLEREGLERVGAAGEPFDPTVHEAVLHEPGDGGESVVVEELRGGYRWHGKVLRAAMVKVRD